MLAVPIAFGAANPAPSTVAMLLSDDDQFALAVTSTRLPSVRMLVAVNCCVLPAKRATVAGATSRPTGMAGPTFNVVFPLALPDVAVMVAGPGESVLARPVGEIVATDTGAALQITALVTSAVPPPLKLPVAANCCC